VNLHGEPSILQLASAIVCAARASVWKRVALDMMSGISEHGGKIRDELVPRRARRVSVIVPLSVQSVALAVDLLRLSPGDGVDASGLAYDDRVGSADYCANFVGTRPTSSRSSNNHYSHASSTRFRFARTSRCTIHEIDLSIRYASERSSS
jgi:hypothetical protein